MLRTAEFAALPEVAVSPRQVRYWCKSGMPHTTDTGTPAADGKRPASLRIDRDAGLAWLKANRTDWTGRGNQHATTDPQRAAAKQRRQNGPSAVAAAKQMAREVTRYAPGDVDAGAEAAAMGVLEAAGVGDVTGDGFEAALTLAKLMACDPAKTVQAKYAAQALRELQQLRKDRGELIEAAPVRRAWVRQAEAARRAMAAVGRICASRLRAALALTSEQAAMLRSVVDAEVDEALRRLTEDAAEDAA